MLNPEVGKPVVCEKAKPDAVVGESNVFTTVRRAGAVGTDVANVPERDIASVVGTAPVMPAGTVAASAPSEERSRAGQGHSDVGTVCGKMESKRGGRKNNRRQEKHAEGDIGGTSAGKVVLPSGRDSAPKTNDADNKTMQRWTKESVESGVCNSSSDVSGTQEERLGGFVKQKRTRDVARVKYHAAERDSITDNFDKEVDVRRCLDDLTTTQESDAGRTEKVRVDEDDSNDCTIGLAKDLERPAGSRDTTKEKIMEDKGVPARGAEKEGDTEGQNKEGDNVVDEDEDSNVKEQEDESTEEREKEDKNDEKNVQTDEQIRADLEEAVGALCLVLVRNVSCSS